MTVIDGERTRSEPDVIAQTRDLLRIARTLYASDRAALAALDAMQTRLDEPLRVAVAGMVKAGKSTLLNALLGERIAATDAGECTRVVTWYRYAQTPSISMHLRDGRTERMQIRRDHGRLVLDLGGRVAEEIDWIDVGWPLGGLESQILIDTPGIASLSHGVSARTAQFLAPEQSASSADAVIYLMRHLHGSDIHFLEAFRDTAAGAAQSVCAVGVLSRADEVGSGRIDSLMSARRVARRYERDGELASLALGVIPMAGLLAEGARTLRESEFIALRDLAGRERTDRERLLVSADRFVRPDADTDLSVGVRQDLLARFGLFGVRLAAAVIRGGVADSSSLSAALAEQSGLHQLEEFIARQFIPRAPALKVRGVMMQLQELVSERPCEGEERIRAGIERFFASAHTLRELSLLALARTGALPLPEAEADDAIRIIGGDGTTAALRLGMAEGASQGEIRIRAQQESIRWRSLAADPTAAPDTAEIRRCVVRSLAGIASEIGGARDLRPAPDVVPSGGPGHGAGEDAEQESQQHQRGLRRKNRLHDLSLRSQRDPFR
ncbi:dynamin family protein [Microbacterium sp. MMO-10]|uniref:dynamin family protein n=1 Tax=Microbacterium sp. MMO-10 TaxID=3081272 RepID=UPI003018A35B